MRRFRQLLSKYRQDGRKSVPAPAKRRSEASRFPLVPQQTERLGVPDLAILWQDSCLGYREGLPNDDQII